MLGNKEATRKVVSRARSADQPANVPLPALQIEGRWTQTIQDPAQRFLLHDNHEDNNRVIVFASTPCLQLISQAEQWFVDGNFSMAPPQFQQLYILRVPLGQSCVTVAYGLLERKTQAAYECFF